MIETIVFDFGNVVGFFDHGRTLQRLLQHTDLSATALREAFAATDLEDAYESGRLTTSAFLEQLRQLFRLRCDDAAVADAWEDIFWANEDVCALVPRLKDRYRLLLGSNTNELHARRFRRQFADTLRHFDGLVLSHEVVARKPRPPFFAACQALAGCPAAKCLFIDDLPANVEGARACGWQGIVYTTFDDLRKNFTELGIHV